MYPTSPPVLELLVVLSNGTLLIFGALAVDVSVMSLSEKYWVVLYSIWELLSLDFRNI